MSISDYMQGEAKRNERRDKKARKARFAPRQGGLPPGMPKALWEKKRKSGQKSFAICSEHSNIDTI